MNMRTDAPPYSNLRFLKPAPPRKLSIFTADDTIGASAGAGVASSAAADAGAGAGAVGSQGDQTRAITSLARQRRRPQKLANKLRTTH